MKIEIGKTYLNRDGGDVKIRSIDDDVFYPVHSEDGKVYTAEGNYLLSGTSSFLDLISEVVPDPTPAPAQEFAEDFVNGTIQASMTGKLFVISSEACLTCRFARCGKDIGNRLECRSQSPVPDNTAGATSRARWPQVNIDDWCGDFERVKPGAAA